MSNLSDGALGALARGKGALWVANAYGLRHSTVLARARAHGLLYQADSDTFTIGDKASAEVLRAARKQPTDPEPTPPPAPAPEPEIVDEHHEHTTEQIARIFDVPPELLSVDPSCPPLGYIEKVEETDAGILVSVELNDAGKAFLSAADETPVATAQDLPALLERAQAIVDDHRVASALDHIYVATGALARALHEHDKRDGLKARAEALRAELAEVEAQLGWSSPAPTIEDEIAAADSIATLRTAGPATNPTQSELRAWATANGLPVNRRGMISNEIRDAYLEAHA